MSMIAVFASKPCHDKFIEFHWNVSFDDDCYFRGLVRLVAGVIGDFKFINRHALAGGFGIFCGLLSVASIYFKTFNILMIYCVLFGIGGGLFIKNLCQMSNFQMRKANRIFVSMTLETCNMSTFNWIHDIDLKCILNLQVLKLVSGFYIGLHGACIYDVVGLKNIARGYAIICCAIGLSNIASLSAAGKLNLKKYNIWRISDQNDRSFSCPRALLFCS